jgi:hypothetical protein
MRERLHAILVGIALLTAAGRAAAAEPADGIFDGHYRCSAGVGGATLSIMSAKGGRLTAVLHFYSLPHKNNIPSGAYRLAGWYVTKTRAVLLNHRAWITHPPGYTALGIRAVLSSDGLTLSGKLVGSTGCSTIELKREAVGP